MTVAPAPPGPLKFGTFELDAAAGELRKNGRKVPLPPQPFELLVALVERPGKVVTREELKNRLWPDDTFVDFDRSLNTAASKVRDALGDSASSPRFIETLPRRGYRFLAAVEGLSRGPGETIDDPQVGVGSQGEESPRRLPGTRAGIAIASAIAFAILTAVFLPEGSEGESTHLPLRLTLAMPGYSTNGWPAISAAVISPDGRYMVYASVENRKLAVWDLSLDRHEILDDTDRASHPFWSPDSKSIGYWTEADEIRRVNLDTGIVTPLAAAAGCCGVGTWSWDGDVIVFSHQGKLFIIPAGGGTPKEIPASRVSGSSSPDHVVQSCSRPSFLPVDGKRVVLVEARTDAGLRLAALNVDTGEKGFLTEPGDWSSPVYSSSGHILYIGGETLWAVPFSASDLEVRGEPFAVHRPAGAPSVSLDQTLLYEDLSGGRNRLIWINREGERIGIVSGPWAGMKYQSLSPDGNLVATLNGLRIGVHEIRRVNQRTLDVPFEFRSRPAWGPNGREILFSSPAGIHIASVDGLEPLKTIHQSKGREIAFASDWSRDGTYVLYDRDNEDIWYLERAADGSYEPKPFLASDSTEKAAQFSPNNRWVAYVSNTSGIFDVYLRRFPNAEGVVKVSTHGGRAVRWSKSGKRLYYAVGATLFEVDVTLGEEARVGVPRWILEWPSIAASANQSAYPAFDVSADEESFLVLEPLPGNEAKVRIAQNWRQEVQGREQGQAGQRN